VDQELKRKELLTRARDLYTQREIAESIGVDSRTVKRWEVREDGPPKYVVPVLQDLLFDYSNEVSGDFTFVDLFAGIGGIRMGFESAGGQCLFTSEWDKYAAKTYSENFSISHEIAGDITQINEKDIPDHDVLLAGFPCQPFSIAGVSKKNALGRKHGFLDETQGTLFFDVARIIKAKKPRAFLLENVKNLKSHDKGRTFEIIKNTLQKDLGYRIFYKVIDSKGFVPQHRERLCIVGFLEETDFSWDAFRKPDPASKTMEDVLHPNDGSEKPENDYTLGKKARINKKYILSDKLWNYLFDYAAKHKAKGNGFGYGMVTKNSIARTLSARYYKDGSEILVSRGRGNPRRLTPRECARLMGFDKTGESNFKIPVSDTQAYKQFGNSVVVPVIEEIARIMKPHIMTLIEEEEAKVHQYALLNA
jgi:DNA (cytosine-5)-methyltransferase 1